MEIKMKKVVCLFICLFAGSVNATIIDFEGVLASGQARIGSNVAPYVEDGFTLTSSGDSSVFHADIFGSGSFTNLNGSDIFGWCGRACPGAPYTLSITNGGAFDLTSIDFSNLEFGDDVGAIDITGFFSGGGSVSTSFGLVVDIWSTVAFAGFSNLSSFSISAAGIGNSLALDNIVLNTSSAVPEPTSLVLLGLGLAGMGFSRKKRAA